MKNKNTIGSIIIKGLNIAAIVYGFLFITEGMRTFTKFTTLSNLGVGISSALFMRADIIKLQTGKDVRSRKGYIFKYVMTSAIILTFIVYITILAPTSEYGFIGAYLNNRGGSLAHHIISPVLAALDFLSFDKDFELKKVHCLAAAAFPVLYVVYIVIIAATGFRWDHGMKAPYNFLNFGSPTGWWGFDTSKADKTTLGIGVGYMLIVLVIMFIMIGILLIRMKKAINSRKSHS